MSERDATAVAFGNLTQSVHNLYGTLMISVIDNSRAGAGVERFSPKSSVSLFLN